MEILQEFRIIFDCGHSSKLAIRLQKGTLGEDRMVSNKKSELYRASI